MHSIVALLAGTAFVLIANGLLGTVIGLRLTQQGQSVGLTGIVVSGFALGMAIGSVHGYRLIARAGHIRAYASFCGTATFATLLMLLLESPIAWLVIRVLSGFCIAGSYLVVESWMSERTPPWRRGVVFAAYITVCQIALGSGQLLVRVYPVTSFEPFVIAGGLYAAALVPVTLTKTLQPSVPSSSRQRVIDVLKASPVAALGAAVAGVSTGSILSLAPLYAAGIGFDESSTSSLMASVVVGGLLLQWPVGWLSDRIDRRIVLGAIALLSMVTALELTVLHDAGFLWLLGGWMALGAFLFLLYPVSLAHAQDLARTEDIISVSGTMVLVYGVGASSGPMVGAVIMEIHGPSILPLWLASFTGALTFIGLARLIIRRRLEIEQPVTFLPLPMPQTIPTTEIDPRSDQEELDG